MSARAECHATGTNYTAACCTESGCHTDCQGNGGAGVASLEHGGGHMGNGGTRRRRTAGAWILALCVAAGITGVQAQTKQMRRITAAVTYVATGSFYFDAGRLKGVAAGDTVTVVHKGGALASGVVTAISSASSAAKVISQSSTVTAGDSVFEMKEVALEEENVASETTLRWKPGALQDNRVSGRIGFQYAGAGKFGQPLDFSQPGLIAQLSVQRLFGTGSTFTVYSRTYRDMSQGYALYGQGSRTKERLFELSLTNDDPRSAYGYGVGRITSRYVGGIGVFDGAQLFARKGNLTAGLMGGTQPDYLTSAFSTDETKFAAFVNYGWGGDVFKTSSVTLAYGQQRYQGKIDRKFGYLQTTFQFSTALFFYSSTEMDMAHRENGFEVNKASITNSFVTLSWNPTDWVSVNAGYDAVRALDLLESMKTFPDSLLDRTLKEGYRTNVSFRLPLRLTLMGNVNFRLASPTTPSARTVGSTLRAADILNTDVSAGAQYQDIRGLYTTGHDWTLDLDRWIAQSLSVSLRLDDYRYVITGQDQRIRTTTGTISLNFALFRSYYASMNFDQVWDTQRNTQRLYAEVGLHF